MKKNIAVALTSLSLAAGAAVLAAVPAQAAEGCDPGAVCYVLDGVIKAEVAPGVKPRTSFDEIVNNSSSTVRVAWTGSGESFIPGYATAVGNTETVRAGKRVYLGDFTTADTVLSVRVVR